MALKDTDTKRSGMAPAGSKPCVKRVGLCEVGGTYRTADKGKLASWCKVCGKATTDTASVGAM